MAETIREKIISAYMTQLETWTPGNGYEFPAGDNAQRATSYIEEGDLPGCVLWPGEESGEKQYGKQVNTMELKVEALAMQNGADTSILKEKLLGETVKVMMDPGGSPAALIEDITYTGGTPGPGEAPEEKVTAIVAKFSVKYKTRIGDPYTQ